MGDGCTKKLASAKYLRLSLLILIPCICALILLLVILLTFFGVINKNCFDTNGSNLLTSKGAVGPDDIPFMNLSENDSSETPPIDLSIHSPFSISTASSLVDQPNISSAEDILPVRWLLPVTQNMDTQSSLADEILTKEPIVDDSSWSSSDRYKEGSWTTDATNQKLDWTSYPPTVTPLSSAVGIGVAPKEAACTDITNSHCQALPYNHTSRVSVLSMFRSIEMEKFLKFFGYLNRLSCYQHIMMFGCSLALPKCVSDGDDSHVLLPCRSFCEAAKEGCEPVLEMVNSSWPEFLKCSQFQNKSDSDNSSLVCFSPQQEKEKQTLCGGQDRFMCSNGICISRKLTCNGYNDCDDWSDEAHCNCSQELFRCSTGKCLNFSFVCDGYDDCGDLADEQHCECNPLKEHMCGDGRCITMHWVCDGDHDCIDKSDEINCSCHSQGLTECGNGQCIPNAFRCDGDKDCKDGSDEDNCSEGQTQCPDGDQGCINPPCLDPCSPFCLTPNNRTNCKNALFKGRLPFFGLPPVQYILRGPTPPAFRLKKLLRLKGQCEVITLELCMNQPYNSTSFPNYLGHRTQKEASISWESSLFPALVQTNCYKYLMFFACTILVPKCEPLTNQRIPPCRSLCEHSKERCESVLGIVGLQWPEDTDCTQFPEENKDNQTCLLPDEGVEECSPSHFKCRSGRCVLASRRCDGQADCEDDSDEENCGCLERGLWECPSNKHCIKPTMICDGFPDCPDQVDEKNCSFCKDDELECANHECVARKFWCNGQVDCEDSSDEWKCVTLSKSTSSSNFLTIHRSAADYHVCADDWQEELTQWACKQMGLGGPSKTQLVEVSDHMHQRRLLHLISDWTTRNASTFQELLEKGHICQNRSKVALQCTKEDCGRRPAARMNKRILGGRTSRPGLWPWQCSLQSEPSGHICGCVLIGKKWVLTVAHCFEGRENAAVWKVVFGINNLDHPSDFMQTRLVNRIILHPRYNRAVVDYDISIVELNEDINETSYVRPVCLPGKEQLVQPDTYCYITGWGHMGSKMPFKLQEGEVRIISLEQCQSYFDMKTITTRMLCAGYESGTVDSCMGDSGGPLVCEQPGGRWILFGLTSWGSVCFSKVLGPGVYSNVSHFVDWIEKQIYIHTFLTG